MTNYQQSSAKKQLQNQAGNTKGKNNLDLKKVVRAKSGTPGMRTQSREVKFVLPKDAKDMVRIRTPEHSEDKN